MLILFPHSALKTFMSSCEAESMVEIKKNMERLLKDIFLKISFSKIFKETWGLFLSFKGASLELRLLGSTCCNSKVED